MHIARTRAGLTIPELWLRYVALTGTRDEIDLEGFLLGLTTLEVGQQDVLAHALNEALEDDFRAQCVPISLPLTAGASAWPTLATTDPR